MAVARTFIPGLNPQNPHYIPGYTGHCPLLRFSMGQTYGQMTGQLLRGSPGLAWPPAHRTLLPPIRPPRSPEPRRRSLPVMRGHERLSSSMVPGYTGFVPQAQFIFAKNCSQVWAEALNGFTQCSGGQGSQELPEEAKGEKDVEKDHEPKPEAEPEAEKEPELGQEAEQVRWRRLRQSPAVGAGSPCLCVAMRRLAAGTEPDHQPHCPASLCYKPGAESVSRFSSLMSPHKASPYSMDDSDPRKFFMSGFTGYVPRARFLFGSSFPVLSNQALLEFGEMKSPGRSRKDPKHLPALSRTYPQHLGLLPKYGGYVPGYKFQFGRTYGHLTQDALALSTLQKQLLV
ncbi:protein FAM166B isoform X1 [Cervus elaphus]|uniref:protein FAM166B isoform X1 n=1 Tax=Cervus canadensis TaxID=1574408 RepID=UPI001C9E6609|nr:protein FAM166B isoform X1 [Cervus canadensis]XP_043746791.1 protein FAM166B isoform X1 [Cervus elaphus]